MKRLLYVIMTAALIWAVSGCDKDDSAVGPVAPEQPVIMAEDHALILFMQGDNGLDEFMDVNLQRVLTVYPEVADYGHVAVFYDRGNYTRLTELYLDDGMVKQRLIKEYNVELSTVDPDFVSGVFDLIYNEIEAESYGLVLSSHGGGWVPSDIYDTYLFHDWSGEASSVKPLFYAQDGYDCMELPDLSASLSARKFDYILFDACFMASVEGLYDLRSNADYIIASSAEILGDGFPYGDIIPLLFRKDHGLKESCEAFMDFYEGRSGTISLIDCSQMDALAAAAKAVYNASDGTVDPTQIQGYESFPIHLYYDFEQYAEQLTSDSALLAAFRSALHNAVPFTDHTPVFFSSAYQEHEIDLPRSCGLTCHVPREEFPLTHEAYLETAWAKYINAE